MGGEVQGAEKEGVSIGDPEGPLYLGVYDKGVGGGCR